MQTTTDILGEPYEAITIDLGSDDQGEVVATLVRRRADTPTRRAVLYVHGWADYFFQTHLADYYIERGFDFYALDMRKYGRSLRDYQSPYFCRSVTEYFPELDEAARIIRDLDGHDTLLINGHSTGGLILSLWAHRLRGRGIIDGVFLNSPFLDLNVPWLVRTAVADALSPIGLARPYTKLPARLPSLYAQALHQEYRGEWTFDLAWKPVEGVDITLGWLRAIHVAHRRIRAGLEIDAPILVQSSTRSFRGATWHEDIMTSDAVLEVAHMARWAPGLGLRVTLVRLDGAVHDVMLSSANVRNRALTELDRWCRAYLPM